MLSAASIRFPEPHIGSQPTKEPSEAVIFSAAAARSCQVLIVAGSIPAFQMPLYCSTSPVLYHMQAVQTIFRSHPPPAHKIPADNHLFKGIIFSTYSLMSATRFFQKDFWIYLYPEVPCPELSFLQSLPAVFISLCIIRLCCCLNFIFVLRLIECIYNVLKYIDCCFSPGIPEIQLNFPSAVFVVSAAFALFPHPVTRDIPSTQTNNADTILFSFSFSPSCIVCHFSLLSLCKKELSFHTRISADSIDKPLLRKCKQNQKRQYDQCTSCHDQGPFCSISTAFYKEFSQSL